MRARDEGVEFAVHLTGDDLRERQIEGDELTIRFSKYDGRVVEITPATPVDSKALTWLITDARECGARTIRSAGHLKITRLMNKYLEHCQRHPEALVLVRLGTGYEALMQHAPVVASALGLPVTARTNTVTCVVPSHEIDAACDRLRELGHTVALMEYESRTPGKRL